MSLRNIIVPEEYDAGFFRDLINLMTYTMELIDFQGEVLSVGNGWSAGNVAPKLVQLNEHMYVLIGDITGGSQSSSVSVLTLPNVELLGDMEVIVKGNTSAGAILIDTVGDLYVTDHGGGSPHEIYFGHLIIVSGI